MKYVNCRDTIVYTIVYTSLIIYNKKLTAARPQVRKKDYLHHRKMFLR